MLFLAGLVCSSMVLQVNAISPKAYIYISSNGEYTSSSTQPPSISTITTRLLLAQRLGLSQYHSLEDADETTIDILNGITGQREQLFLNGNQERGREKLLAIVESVEQPEDLMPRKSSPSFTIENPPSVSQNRQFAIDLLLQDQHRRLKDTTLCAVEISETVNLRGGTNSERNRLDQCALAATHSKHLKGGDAIQQLRYLNSMKYTGQESTTILHIALLEGLARKDKLQYKEAIESLKLLIRRSLEDTSTNQESIILLMPPHSQNSKRSPESSYGAYSNPSPLLLKRQQVEAPLTSLPEPSDENLSPSVPKILKAIPPLRGIIPICHPSLKEAIAATNNCSSHGIPYKKYNDPTSKAAQACYTCNCSTTVRVNEDGKFKTTQWGGPACQKKDVSVPFWLLAGLSISIVTMVSWAIGLLFSIGEEALPSVIGAGVGGPKVQK